MFRLIPTNRNLRVVLRIVGSLRFLSCCVSFCARLMSVRALLQALLAVPEQLRGSTHIYCTSMWCVRARARVRTICVRACTAWLQPAILSHSQAISIGSSMTMRNWLPLRVTFRRTNPSFSSTDWSKRSTRRRRLSGLIKQSNHN